MKIAVLCFWLTGLCIVPSAFAQCLPPEEETLTNYSQNIQSVVTELPKNPDLAPPDFDAIRSAIEAAFVRIPRKGSWFRSFSAAKPARMYDAPSTKALELGRIEPRTRLPLVGYTPSQGGCKEGFLRIGISSWVCLSSFVPDKEDPEFQLLPIVPENALTPGEYAYVRLGGAPWYPNREAVKNQKPGGTHPAGFYLQFKRFVKINGINYWKTDKNQYVPVDAIARHNPSMFSGVLLVDRKLPLGFPIRKGSKRENLPVPIYDRPRGKIVAQSPAREPLPLLGEKTTGRSRWYRVGTCRWVAARDVAVAFQKPVPPGLRKGEKWLDVDLDQQTLVAYIEHKPIFATVVSTGKEGYSTKRGIFRIYWKVGQTDMKNEVGADEQYLASSVPWSMFFWKGQALHGAYWHDDFGIPKSHGCINLAPKDARFLFEWSTPSLPVGAAWMFSGPNRPGMVVRIRGGGQDEPMVYGYARQFVPAEQLSAMDRAWEQKLAAQSIEALRAFEQEKNQTVLQMEPGRVEMQEGMVLKKEAKANSSSMSSLSSAPATKLRSRQAPTVSKKLTSRPAARR